jgi:hypothetical protein
VPPSKHGDALVARKIKQKDCSVKKRSVNDDINDKENEINDKREGI